MQKLPLTVQVAITRFSKKGNGIGQYSKDMPDGSSHTYSLELPFTCPGDVAIAEVKKRPKKSSSSKNGKGALLNLLTPSPSRISPKCIHFGTCGGCRLQHISYPDQLEFKENYVKQLFSGLAPKHFHPILPSENVWGYRNKMEFSFSQDREKNRYLGLMMEGGRGRVLNLTECHLVSSWFIEALKATRQWWEETGLAAYHPYKDTGSLRTLVVREAESSRDRLVMLTVSGNPDFAISKKDLEHWASLIKKAVDPSEKGTLSIVLRIQQIAKGQPTEFYEMMLLGPDTLREELRIFDESFIFQISPTAFFQTNTRQAGRLFEKVIEIANFDPDDVVYDLYCGTGTLGIMLSRSVKTVLGIELSAESALDANENIKANGIKNMQVLSGAVKDVLAKIEKEKSHPSPDAVIIDPPRSGLDPKALSLLLELNAPKIIYVSCNPETQARDVQILMEKGYQLQDVQPVDQFPQTYHVENIALLIRP